MSAIDQVIEWAENELPDWQADAVRRILTQDSLTEKDKSELLSMLKERHELGNSQNPAPAPNKSVKGTVSGSPKSKVGIVLKALEEIKNVNAIPENSYIPFENGGLNIIYGGNGTGKSGYARVLKRACSARDTTEPIQPNVFGASVSGVATAKFKISVQGEGDKEISWKDDGAKEDLLANIIVFDSKEARVIVDEENNVSFLPYGAHVFGQLVDLLKEFKATLTSENPSVGKLEYREVLPNTNAGRFLNALSALTSNDAIDTATRWVQEDIDKLEGLKTRIFEAESPDKAANIRKLANLLSAIESLQKDIIEIDAVLSTTKEQTLKQAIDEVVVAEQALAVSEQQSSGSEPLQGVGGKTWQALYLAAKEYSEQEAYPDKTFPATEDNSRCVLCMQYMLGDTIERFHRFHEFMTQTTKKKHEEAEAKLKSVLQELEAVNFSQLAATSNTVLEIQERDTQKNLKLDDYRTGMSRRLSQMLEAARKRVYSSFSSLLPNPNVEITNIHDAIKRDKAALETVTPAQLQVMQTEKQELDSKRVLSLYKDKILEHVEALKRASRYDETIAETALHGVSSKGKKVISEALTPELQKELKGELAKLEASYLPIENTPTRADGEVVYKLSLTKAKLPKKVSLTDILSEGEQRVVAIAGFFAELQVSGEKNPIVFDDPVSSLDHTFRNKIAYRIAQEAKDRQVIVFTHDITFLIALQKHSEELGNANVTVQTIRRKGRIPGYSAQGVPWHAMKVGQRLDHLLTRKLPEFEAQYQADMEKYNSEAANFYGMLRETWESFIEEELLYLVVRRHSAEIQTKRLVGVEIVETDHGTVFQSMDKCSEWMTGHDKSKALDENRPSPTEIKADVQKLHELGQAVRARRKQREKERETKG